MSYCVSINSLENLPVEETLLINYTVSCSGVWYLYQMATAYRNICASGWTVMYPNHQHPQHSDFPLHLATNGNYSATFAWNYGGIQGISAENFDESHSYLVQLSLLDHNCLNTGEPPGDPTGATGTTGNGGSGGGPTTGSPKIPQVPGGGGPFPGGPSIPAPATGKPGGGGGGPSGTASGPRGPAAGNPKVPAGPTTGGPAGPSAAAPTGPATGGPAGPSAAAPTGPTTGGPSGPSAPAPTAAPAGPTTGGPAGPSAPKPTVPPSGPTTGGPSGPSASAPTALGEPGPGPGQPVLGGIYHEPVNPNLPGAGETGIVTGAEPTLGEIIFTEPLVHPNTNVPYVPKEILSAAPSTNNSTPGPPVDPPGTQQSNYAPVTDWAALENKRVTQFTRPSSSPAGSTENDNLQFYPMHPSPTLPQGQVTNLLPPGGPDLSKPGDVIEGAILGNPESQLVNPSFSPLTEKINTFNTKNIDKTSKLDVIISSSDIIIGESIVISACFSSQQLTKAKMEITIQDNSRSSVVGSTAFLDIGPKKPLTCGVSANSSNYNLGGLIVTCRVSTEDGRLIAIKSNQIIVTDRFNNTSAYSSKVTQSNDVPDKILRHSKATDSAGNPCCVNISLKHNSSTFAILSSKTSQEEFSAVLQTFDTTNDSYSIAMYNAEGSLSDILSGQYLLSGSDLYSDSRYKVGGEEISPETHTAGLELSPISATQQVVVELSPAINNSEKDTFGKLFLKEGFNLREASGELTNVTADTYSVTVSLPYIKESYGLIVNGRAQGTVPSTYSENSVISNELGQATWNNVTLLSGEYYTVVQSKNGVINPFDIPVFNGRLL
jgi:hypothetical protein